MDDHEVLGLKKIENGFLGFLHNTAKQVHSLLKQDKVKKRFQQQIDAFMELWYKHGTALQPYKAQAKAKNKIVIAKDLPVDPLCWFTPPTKEIPRWYLIDRNGMTSIDNVVFPAVIREPDDNESLMRNYVKLIIIHDLLAKRLETQAFFFSIDDIVEFSGSILNADLSANGEKGYMAQNIWEKITNHQDQWNDANEVETKRIEIALEMVKADLEQIGVEKPKNTNGAESPEKKIDCFSKAGQQWNEAVQGKGGEPTNRKEAYDWLIDSERYTKKELGTYDTWARYVRGFMEKAKAVREPKKADNDCLQGMNHAYDHRNK